MATDIGIPRRTIGRPLDGSARLTGAIGLVIVVVVWEVVAQGFLATPSSRPGAIPPPHLIAIELVRDLGSGVVWKAIGDTSLECLQGFLIGNVIALLLAFLVALAQFLERQVQQFAVASSCLPITAVAPLVVLMSPAGSRTTSVFLAALGVLFTSTVGALVGLRAATPAQLDVLRAFGGGRVAQLFKIRLIAALPAMLAGLRYGAPAAFVSAVIGEYFLVGVDSGLGILLQSAQRGNDTVALWATGLICAAVAGTAFWMLASLGRLVAPWATGQSPSGALGR